jgi:8-oxo-dGTP pyrophosphatase MutT (NUDIX family)
MKSTLIRPIALCLFRRENRILVSTAYDSVKKDYYCRPLGGGIEFGERGAEAIVREIREELGAEIEKVRLVGTLENLFSCEGQPGHEIVLLFDAVFIDRSLYEQLFLHGHEAGAAMEAFTAEWKTLDELTAGNARLVPEELIGFLSDHGEGI